MRTKTISSRDRALAAIGGLAGTATYDDMMYKLYVLQKIEKGEQDIAKGMVYSTKEAKKRLAKWLK